MKKLIPVAIALISMALLPSCDKGDDNPYGNWKCTCFVTRTYSPTLQYIDTIVLNENDMDRNTAKAYCEKAKEGFMDTTGVVADCKIK